MIYQDIAKQIEELREKLYESIDSNGLNSVETRKISLELDELINKYYEEIKEEKQETIFSREYNLAYQKLLQITKDFGEFPTTAEWNKYAKENNLLNHISIQAVSGLDWNQLRAKILSKKIFLK